MTKLKLDRKLLKLISNANKESDRVKKSDILLDVANLYHLSKNWESLFDVYTIIKKIGVYNVEIQLFITAFNKGDLRYAFKNYYHRWYSPSDFKLGFTKSLPIANTADMIRSKNVLVLTEQGFGDEIMSSLTFKWLSTIVKDAYVQVRKPLIRLFKTLYNYDNIHFFVDEIEAKPLSHYDIQVGLMDIFAFYYLEHGKAPISPFNYGDNIKLGDSATTVGIVPFSLPNSENNTLKDISPDIFCKYQKEFSLSLLQPISNGHPKLPKCLTNIDAIPETEDFLYTFKKLLEIDAVFTVDTAVAHLAGVMGIQNVFVIINKHFDWRWKFLYMYPNVKIIHYKDIHKHLKGLRNVTTNNKN